MFAVKRMQMSWKSAIPNEKRKISDEIVKLKLMLTFQTINKKVIRSFILILI